MGRINSCLSLRLIYVQFLIILIASVSFTASTQAITASYGRPYSGRLVNGIPFPTQFPGYQIRPEEQTYTTPEVIGAMLDAIDAVREQNPETCDVYLGDFSRPGGGPAAHHRSHQNGRDVDLGMYAKGNRLLNSFIPMNEENLDVAKTWCLMENLIRSQRIQYIFLDRSVQRLLHEYALSRGVDAAYLERVFGNTKGSVVQHVRNHVDHMHVRFFTPWSTLAAHIGSGDDQKRTVIEMAQQAYLPKKVNYYVKGNERSIDALAQSFGVSRRDLCRWNQIHGNNILPPGSCLVFYKRGFEVEPVHLAQALQPGFVAETPPTRTFAAETPPPRMQLASLPPTRVITDVPTALRANPAHEREKKLEPSQGIAFSSYTVRRGDTIAEIAKQNHMEVKAFCQMNGLKNGARLRPGRTLKIPSIKPGSDSKEASATESPQAKGSRVGFAQASLAESTSPKPSAIVALTIEKGDTLPKISKKTGIPVDVLCRMNGISKDTALKPGRKLQLASADPVPKALVVPQKSFTPEKGAAAQNQARQNAKSTPDKDKDKNRAKVASVSSTQAGSKPSKESAPAKSTPPVAAKSKSVTAKAPAQMAANTKEQKKEASKTASTPAQASIKKKGK